MCLKNISLNCFLFVSWEIAKKTKITNLEDLTLSAMIAILAIPLILPLGQISVQGMHILMRFSSTSILLLGHALTQELWSTTKLSGEKQVILNVNYRWLLFVTQEHSEISGRGVSVIIWGSGLLFCFLKNKHIVHRQNTFYCLNSFRWNLIKIRQQIPTSSDN